MITSPALPLYEQKAKEHTAIGQNSFLFLDGHTTTEMRNSHSADLAKALAQFNKTSKRVPYDVVFCKNILLLSGKKHIV